MATASRSFSQREQSLDKGLKSGAIGLVSSIVIAIASIAPAYSLAATLRFRRGRGRPQVADRSRFWRSCR